MKFNIRGNNLEVTPALREYAEKKLSRLERYFDTPVEAEVYVSLAVQRDEHKVEVTVPLPGLLIRAEEARDDMYASIDLVVEKLERQIRKYKTKVNRKFRQEGSLRSQWMDTGAKNGAADREESDTPEVVRIKRFSLKPMDVEEAILQMDLLGHNFFVFSNMDTNRINVVYRRRDGRYGLIEPE